MVFCSLIFLVFSTPCPQQGSVEKFYIRPSPRPSTPSGALPSVPEGEGGRRFLGDARLWTHTVCVHCLASPTNLPPPSPSGTLGSAPEGVEGLGEGLM